MRPGLDLALIGNGSVGALIDSDGEIVWSCLPRFDGDPVFCSLLHRQRPQDSPTGRRAGPVVIDGIRVGTPERGDGNDRAASVREVDATHGYFRIDLVDVASREQRYVDNSAVLVTRRRGGCVEITDFAPRFSQFGRMFHPTMLVRRIAGSPRITVRLRPACDYGAARPTLPWGSNHIRCVTPTQTLRLATDAPITALPEETPFFLEDRRTLLLGPDETVPDSADEVGRHFEEETVHHWQDWVRTLAIPFDWQDAVIRAAITLQLNACDDTGAIVAAMTTSIPEAAGSARNWDYRYCWLRDACFVVNALNRLGATRTMERYLGCIVNNAADVGDAPLQPVLGIDGRRHPDERIVMSLSGYHRDTGPVRVGNQACQQIQHDGYGSAVPAAAHIFFDRRQARLGDAALFGQLEPLGDKAFAAHDQPDAGLRELRGSAPAHAFSSVTCWAACDRPARIATHLGLTERAAHWRGRASTIHKRIPSAAWNPERSAFTSTFGGSSMDTSLLLLAEVGFVEVEDPRFAGAVAAIETDLRRGDFIFRYVEKDDFGEPENAFLVCSFWYVNALEPSAARPRPARCSKSCCPTATATGYSPSTSTRAPVNNGAISSRPTAWSAGSTPQSGCRFAGIRASRQWIPHLTISQAPHRVSSLPSSWILE